MDTDSPITTPCPRCGGKGTHHIAARRRAKTGTQGIKGARDRAIVPYELSEDICIAVEKALA